MIVIFLFGMLCNVPAQDHREFIEGPFETPQEVTATCLTCHEDVGNDILQTQHWNWLGEEFQLADRGLVRMGKRNIINNFCIAIPSNWPRCTSCHVGFGWKDDEFDFSNAENIDCLVCHEQTGTYVKVPTAAGMPAESVDLLSVAQSVALPTRANCGSCHFNGGGGNAVKHGDLDKSLLNASAELDVHIGGLDFECIECHHSANHKISGASHGSMAQGVSHFGCEQCHESEPHGISRLNKHTARIACETCHIPTIGRGAATKVWWDWSLAGKDTSLGTDESGNPLFDKKKGEFKWAADFIPEYRWFNGRADYYFIGDQIDPTNQVISLNQPEGDKKDPKAKIYPFKKMLGKQMYDTQTKMILIPKLFGENGFWKTYDWETAFTEGMQSVNLEYSGSYDFIETEFFIPVNHTVVPKSQSLKCMDCHHKTDGRLNWKELGYAGDPMRLKMK